MSQQYTTGKALYDRYSELYKQHIFGTVPAGVSQSELEYAIEIMEIMAGKYGEDAGIPSEEYMCELLEKAHTNKSRVGYIERNSSRIDAATGMEITTAGVDNFGYIGIL
jgi:hypothetical protein